MPNVPLRLKALRPKDYSETPQTLGQHLKKRRRELRLLLQRQAAATIGIDLFTYINWERDRTRPVASRFRPMVAFLGYDPSPAATTLAERVQAKRRALGVTFDQVAQHLGWDHGSLYHYVVGVWRMKPERAAVLEAFLAADPSALRHILELPKRQSR